MYLKNIEIQGFKSFANKIVLEFHNGITGIVGPNGSGKSNVADAVRWVLGEQRAKQLRGANMQDVIFSGTELRRPLSYASVAITLDNSDHSLAVDFDEVTVTRRVYRSGESEYLLNGASCRLKDINELFYDTGIGKEGYSIIGQGQIDKILSGKPEERRELFDEAAGIVKFKRRKATAQKKLEEEAASLVRINDILAELERQKGPLERQSQTARVYLKKKEELRVYDVNYFLCETARIREQIKDLEEKQENASRELETARRGFEEARSEYDRQEEELAGLEQQMEEARQAASNTVLKRQGLENQIAVLKEQINTARANDEHIGNRLEAIGEEEKAREKELREYAGRKEEADSQEQASRQAREAAEKKLSDIREGIARRNAAIDSGKSDIIELLNARASTKGRLQRYDTMLEQAQLRKAQLSAQVLQLKSEESRQEEDIRQLEGRQGEVRKLLEGYEADSRRLEARAEELQQEIIKLNEQIEAGQTAYHRESSRLESLRTITERYDGYGNSIRRVMEQRKTHPGIVGVVADLIQVEKEYETAVETALGGSIQNIVTDTEETAKEMIRFLKQNRAGRATFLPLTSVKNRSVFSAKEALREPGVIGLADSLVKTRAEYRELVGYLLGRTVVAKNIDTAIALARKYRYTLRIVTLEGESLSPGGSMTGGAFRNAGNLLGRRREIEELESSVKLLKADLDKSRERMDSLRRERNECRSGLVQLKEKMQEQYLAQNTLEMERRSLEEKKAEVQGSYEGIRAEQSQLDAQLADIRQSQEEIQEEWKNSKQREEALEQAIEEASQALERDREEEARAAQETQQLALQEASCVQNRNFLLQNEARIREELSKLAAEREELSESQETAADEIARKQEEIFALRDAAEATIGEGEEQEKRIRLLRDRRDEASARHKESLGRREELSLEMGRLDKEAYRLNSQREKLEEAQEAQVSYMWEEYELTYSMAKELRREELDNPAAMKKQISALKDEIRSLGSVNVNAIEDYKNLIERYEFLGGQRADLEEAKEALLKVIEELDEGMRRQFEEQFGAISREFEKAFRELFGGGKAALSLTEGEDILEAGIMINAQPPGKKLQNMMQLSGGEKALTAISLLFAIQNLKPSPFCLLDEIEAALDDSNVGRFADYLHKLTKNTQFIIITHRRGTMNSADRLYGITMQEKGVSTLVSVDLIEKDLDK